MIQTRPMTAAERSERDRMPAVFSELPSIAEHMAAHMVDIAAVNDGCCQAEHLLLRGFTVGELHHHGAEANRLAILSRGGGRA